ncbi:MAG: signal peptidase II [Streptosporangiaceae bacterium]|jgi:signal peptidase II
MQAARGTPLSRPAGAAESEQPAGQERPRRVGILVAVALTVLALDIATKVTVVATMSDRSCGPVSAQQPLPPLRVVGGLLKLCVSRNPGAAFSIGTGMTIIFTAIAVGVIILILRTSRQIRSLPWAITLGLLLGGATGNLTDRIFRYPAPFRGYVVDWIQLPHWPVFNLADSSIVCGGVLAVLLSAQGIRLDGQKPPAADAVAERGAAPVQPADGQPADGQPADGQPADGQPEHGQPEHGQPEHGQPEHGAPEHGAPEERQPEHGQPEDGQAGQADRAAGPGEPAGGGSG